MVSELVCWKSCCQIRCKDCGELARTYFHKDFYDVGEDAWVTDCGTGGCGFEAAKTRRESAENFRSYRAEVED